MTDYLVNPARKRRSKSARTKARARRTSRRRSPPKGFKTWAAYMASIRPARAQNKGGTGMSKKRRRSRKGYRRKASAAVVGRVGGRRRSYRRNPPIGRGIIGKVMQGVTDAALGVVGKAASRAVPSLIGLPQGGAVGIATQAAVGIAAGMVADKVKPGAGRAVLQGALMGPIESLVKGLNIPVISTALGDDYEGYALAGYEDSGVAGYVGAGTGMGDGAELSTQQAWQ